MKLTLYAAFFWEPLSNRVLLVLRQFVSLKIENFFSKVKAEIPFSSMVLNEDLEKKLKQQAEDELLDSVSEIHHSLSFPLGWLGATIGFFAALVQTFLVA